MNDSAGREKVQMDEHTARAPSSCTHVKSANTSLRFPSLCDALHLQQGSPLGRNSPLQAVFSHTLVTFLYLFAAVSVPRSSDITTDESLWNKQTEVNLGFSKRSGKL